MSKSVCAHWLPTMFSPEDLRGGVAVVIDVLRASTTITQALAAGAKAVIPCEDVAQAQERAAAFPAGTVLLGGERGGVKIAGFDLGNSPLEYTPERITGKTLVFTTTNGTKALERCRQAERILIGTFANLDAVARLAGRSGLPVHLVCAGTDGEISAEDVLCAGALMGDLQVLKGHKILVEHDANRLAFELYAPCAHNEALLLEALRSSNGGRNLQALGYDADIVWTAQRNRFTKIPEYHKETGHIVFA